MEPGSGFLTEEHTFDNFRSAQWSPRLLDRTQYDVWEKAESKDMYSIAVEGAKTILADHKVPELPAEAETVINDILEERRLDQ